MITRFDSLLQHHREAEFVQSGALSLLRFLALGSGALLSRWLCSEVRGLLPRAKGWRAFNAP